MSGKKNTIVGVDETSFPLPVPDYEETQPHDFDLEGFIQQLTRQDGAPGET